MVGRMLRWFGLHRRRYRYRHQDSMWSLDQMVLNHKNHRCCLDLNLLDCHWRFAGSCLVGLILHPCLDRHKHRHHSYNNHQPYTHCRQCRHLNSHRSNHRTMNHRPQPALEGHRCYRRLGQPELSPGYPILG